MHIHKRHGWELPEREVTPEAVMLGRRALLAGTAAGFLDEVDRMPADGWDRGATRLPQEWRTARWVVRHTAHEGVHHLADIRRGLRAERSASRR